MRTFRTIVFVALVVPSVVFLFGYARIVCWMWQASDYHSIGLLAEPHLCIFRAEEHGARSGWEAFMLTDAPEGTRSIFYSPSWPFALAAAGVLVYSPIAIFRRRPNKSLQATAAAPASCD